MLARLARIVAGALRSPPDRDRGHIVLGGGAVRPRAHRVDDALDDFARRLASRLHEKALQAEGAELTALRIVRLEDAGRVEENQVAWLHVNRPAAVNRIGRGPEDHPRRLELAERAARGMQMQGRRMARVHVDDVAVRLELAVEQRHELRRETALVQDAVQPLDRAGDLEVASDAHAQADVDVAHEKRREKAVARGVRDRRAEAQIAEREKIVEVAADGLGGKGKPVELEVPHLRHRARKDRLLNSPGVLPETLEPLRAHLRVDDGPDDPEREEEILLTRSRMDVKREEIALPAEGDGREARHAEALLELAIHGRVVEVGKRQPVLLRAADGPVVGRDRDARGDSTRTAETPLEDVLVLAPHVKAPAEDAQLIPEIPDDRLAHLHDRREDVLAAFDGLESPLDVLQEEAVVHRRVLTERHALARRVLSKDSQFVQEAVLIRVPAPVATSPVQEDAEDIELTALRLHVAAQGHDASDVARLRPHLPGRGRAQEPVAKRSVRLAGDGERGFPGLEELPARRERRQEVDVRRRGGAVRVRAP